MPKISVCIPSHNSECWIAEAIESIIDQTFEDWEIVVVDNGSTDTTIEILKHYDNTLKNRFRLFNSSLPGIAMNRNKANAMAKGEIIVVQDSDDLSHKDRLKHTWAYFKRHSAIDLIYGAFQYIDFFGKPIREEPSRPWSFEEWKKHNYIAHPTVAYRRKAVMEVPYRKECVVLDDLFLYLDFHKAGKKIANLQEVLAFYRIRRDSVSNSEDKVEIIKSLKKKFEDEIK